MDNQNNSSYTLQDQILKIQNLAQKINQDGRVDRKIIRDLSDKCQQLDEQLEQSQAFNNNYDDVSIYTKSSKINSPLDDYTNLI